MSRGAILALLAVVAGVVALAVGMLVLATSDDDTLVLDLDPGECFQLPADMSEATIEQVRRVDCSEAHDAEVFAAGELNPDRDQPYPSDERLFARVDRACSQVFSQRADLVERFGVLPVVPNEASWEPYRGRYVCVAIPFGGGTTEGSLGV